MIAAPIPSHEAARLAALHRYQILDTSSEPAFDELARLAAYICRAPIAVISFVDSSRQWFKSTVGLSFADCPRSEAFCAHTILGTDLFIVDEAAADERFADHPWVVESPSISFYAGVPLITPDGQAIGSLAVMDVVPRTLTPEQSTGMQTLAKQVMAQLLLRSQACEIVSMPCPNEQRSERENQFCTIFEQAPVGIATIDSLTGIFKSINSAYCEMMGYTPEEMLVRTFQSITHPDDLESDISQMKRLLAGEIATFTIDKRYFKKNGELIWVHLTCVPLWLESSAPRVHMAFVTDITEGKQTENALREVQQKLQQALHASHTGLWDWNTDSGEVSFSKEWKRQLGYGESELSDNFETWASLLHPEDRARAMLYAQAYCDNPVGSFRQDFRLRHKDGSYRWIDSHASFVTEADGRRIRLLGSHTDITERKQAEEALRQSEERLRFALETGHIGAWDLDLVTHRANRSLEHGRIFGYRTLLAGWSYGQFLEHVLPDDRGLVDEKFRRAVADRSDWSFECRIRRMDGQIRWIWAAGRNHVDAAGAVHRMAGIVQDITERKRAEQLRDGQRAVLELIAKGAPLSETLTRLCEVVESQSDGVLCSILIKDGDCLRYAAGPSLPAEYVSVVDGIRIGPAAGSCGTAVYRNDTVRVDDIASDPLWEDFREAAQRHGLHACRSTPIRDGQGAAIGTFAVYHRGGRTLCPKEYELVETGAYLSGIAIDRDRSEHALRDSEERFRLVAEAPNDILWDWDLVTQDRWWSPNARVKFGYDPNVESTIMAWTGRLHPDDHDRVMTLVGSALASEAATVAAEYRFRLADGSYGYFYDRGQIVRDASGQAIRMIGAMIDVTFTKRAYASLEAAYQRLQSMSLELQAVETNERRRLSRELHDEVGQLLTALKFDLEAIRQALSDKTTAEDGHAYERTVRAVETTDELFVRLRRVVRALRPSVLDELGLQDALEAMVSDIQSRSDLVCSVSVEGEVVKDPIAPAIEAALYRMAQELMTNVVRHAQAMTLFVALKRDTSQWILTVQDDGVGFNQKAESISGMGIRGVRERAEILGGHVDISFLPGAGTTITVWIPVPARAVLGDSGNGM